MDGDSVSSSGLEWENLGLYSGRPVQLGFSMPPSSNVGNYPASQESSREESLDGVGKISIGCSSSDPMGLHNLDPIIALRLGHHKEYGTSTTALLSSSSLPVSSTPTKRSRASYHNMQNPCCQVQGCNLDLKLAKDYHRRHRICETHSKTPKVIVAGMERRFCQQCSRFHDLSEFDDKKRSCRRRLSDHNARRRRVQPESVQLTSPGLSPALYDQRQQNVLLNGLPVSLSNPRWETSISRHAIMDPDRLSSSIHPRILDQFPSSTNASMAPDILTAHSLLSSNSWSLNEAESASMEGINVHGNYSPVMRHSDPESHHLSLFQTTNNIGVDVDQGPPASLLHSINLHSNVASSHQEYQLFKDPYDSATFYSTQRSL